MRSISKLHAGIFCAMVGGLLASASVYPLHAQQAADNAVAVDVRASVQDGFIRFVFSAPGLPAGRVAEEAGRTALQVTFNAAVRFDAPAVDTIAPRPQLRIDGRAVHITVPGMQRQRHMRLGQRLLVDVFTADAPREVAAPVAPAQTTAPAPVPAAPPAPAAEPAPAAVDDSTAQALPDVQDVTPPAPVSATPLQTPAASAAVDAPYAGEAVISLGSTQGLMLAAFMRDGFLWIVSSGDASALPPQITGKNAADVRVLETQVIDGGRIYKISLPKGAQIRPEGGGLIWRLHVGATGADASPVTGSPDFSDKAAGPKLKLNLLSAGSVLRVRDPLIGDDLAAVLVGRAGAHIALADQYVDFELVPAIVGAFIRPRVDGFSVAVLPDEVVLGRQGGGLRLSPAGARRTVATVKPDGSAAPAATPAEAVPLAANRIYDFESWGMGGATQYFPMRRAIDARIAAAELDFKLPEILNGAKFMLAQGLPHEALGFMQMAQGLLPLLRESADFQALSGAVYTLLGHYPAAIEAFKNPGLASHPEIGLWRAHALAGDGQLDAAQASLPRGTILPMLASYPPRIQALLMPHLLDTVLARGDVRMAEGLIDLYAKNVTPEIDPEKDLMLGYYRGRAAILRGDQLGANTALKEVVAGRVGPYPVRATLALVERGLSGSTLGKDEAVQLLERFRFGWRGDALERDVLEKLGMVYIQNDEYRRGLSILRGAAALAPLQKDRDALIGVMRQAFRDLFTKESGESMSAIEAASVAAEFAELMPAGGEGDDITLSIASRMMEIDLLDRAAGMIEPLALRTTNVANALKYAERAAGIRLLDRKPKAAADIIDKVLKRPEVVAAQADGSVTAEQLRALRLLSIQSKADMNRTDEAIADLRNLPEGQDSLRLLVDTTWKAQRWAVAADALGRLIAHANLNATRTPTPQEAQMVLNRALALNLAGDTAALENLSIGYRDIMRRTPLYRPFLVVTRSSREAQLADRATLMSLVSEVALFQDVLDSYKNNDLMSLNTESSQPD